MPTLLEEMLSLLESDGQAAMSWDTLECASKHCLAMGDAHASQRYAARAAECAQLALGAESHEFQQYVAMSGGQVGVGAAKKRNKQR